MSEQYNCDNVTAMQCLYAVTLVDDPASAITLAEMWLDGSDLGEFSEELKIAIKAYPNREIR